MENDPLHALVALLVAKGTITDAEAKTVLPPDVQPDEGGAEPIS